MEGILQKIKNKLNSLAMIQQQMVLKYGYPKKIHIAVAAIVIMLIAVIMIGKGLLKATHVFSPVDVGVFTSVQKQVPIYLDYVGTVDAVKTVDIKARVKGFLVERSFVEGQDVKAGDFMFAIDPREYEAKVNEAKARLAKDEAALVFANQQVERYEPLVKKDYITKEAFQGYVTQASEAQAIVEQDKASLNEAELNLSYCKMASPIDGRVGKTYVNAGNYVGADGDTRLATVVSLDPIYVYFSPSEEDFRKINAQMAKGDVEFDIKFSDGSQYSHKGKVDFINNVVDKSTNTVLMRGVVENPQRTLLPGTYVNVNLLLSQLPDAVLIPQEALSSDQGGSYVLVVDQNGTVEQRYVKLGSKYAKFQVVTDGIKVGEDVVVKGVQIARPGSVVKKEVINLEVE